MEALKTTPRAPLHRWRTHAQARKRIKALDQCIVVCFCLYGDDTQVCTPVQQALPRSQEHRTRARTASDATRQKNRQVCVSPVLPD